MRSVRRTAAGSEDKIMTALDETARRGMMGRRRWREVAAGEARKEGAVCGKRRWGVAGRGNEDEGWITKGSGQQELTHTTSQISNTHNRLRQSDTL